MRSEALLLYVLLVLIFGPLLKQRQVERSALWEKTVWCLMDGEGGMMPNGWWGMVQANENNNKELFSDEWHQNKQIHITSLDITVIVNA